MKRDNDEPALREGPVCRSLRPTRPFRVESAQRRHFVGRDHPGAIHVEHVERELDGLFVGAGFR